MPRKPRVEYAEAVYHVMSRGNRSQKVFRTDGDCEAFVEALGEVCRRTGWRVHAYVLMGNHYHLLLETPEANLVAGMQWLQSTYAKRFNARHREWGHLFQGRYKAIPVEPGTGYFTAAADYIHLNPVRRKGYDFAKARLEDQRWSSYPGYVGACPRPEWLHAKTTLAGLGISDTSIGRRKYAEYMMGRIEEIRQSAQPWKADENWQKIRRGWALGGEKFRRDTLARLGPALEMGKKESFCGDEVKIHDEVRAEELIQAGLKKLDLTERDLTPMIKNSPEKYALAWLVRRNTCVSPGWIKNRLGMGKATNFAELLKRIATAKKGEWGHAPFAKIQAVKAWNRRADGV